MGGETSRDRSFGLLPLTRRPLRRLGVDRASTYDCFRQGAPKKMFSVNKEAAARGEAAECVFSAIEMHSVLHGFVVGRQGLGGNRWSGIVLLSG